MKTVSLTPPALVPKPVRLDLGRGAPFVFGEETTILTAAASRPEARILVALMKPALGLELPIRASHRSSTALAKQRAISLQLVGSLEGRLGKEGYLLEIDAEGVRIQAAARSGLFYAIQTLRQLLPAETWGAPPSSPRHRTATLRLPPLRIEDYPRFRWRGLHLDVCRHFMPPAFVKRYIDLLALHKLNTFHWHLTEDQGWRIEIKKYPRLTSVGAWRKETLVGHYRRDRPHRFDGQRHGGFYTQAEIREIVTYAAARHVTIVPEIEMPGHAQAALAAYPELGNTGQKVGVLTKWGVSPHIFSAREKTIRFLQDVLTEVLALFPGRYIHIGGDEAPKDQWKASPEMQALIKKLGLKDEEQLQSYFIERMDRFLSERGRRLVGWDEILQGGLAKGATVMSWRGTAGGIAAAKAGHDVVMAPTEFTYFDFYQGDPTREPLCIGELLPLKKVYRFEPVPRGLTAAQAKHILGAQGQLWTEYMKTPRRVEYMAYPRASALAEVLWSPRRGREYAEFLRRLRVHLLRLSAMKVAFRPLDGVSP